MRGQHSSKASRLPRVTRFEQAKEKCRGENVSCASGVHFRDFRRTEPASVTVPIKHRACRTFCDCQYAGVMCHILDHLIVTVYVFLADDYCTCLLQGGFCVLPGA